MIIFGCKGMISTVGGAAGADCSGVCWDGGGAGAGAVSPLEPSAVMRPHYRRATASAFSFVTCPSRSPARSGTPVPAGCEAGPGASPCGYGGYPEPPRGPGRERTPRPPHGRVPVEPGWRLGYGGICGGCVGNGPADDEHQQFVTEHQRDRGPGRDHGCQRHDRHRGDGRPADELARRGRAPDGLPERARSQPATSAAAARVPPARAEQAPDGAEPDRPGVPG